MDSLLLLLQVVIVGHRLLSLLLARLRMALRLDLYRLGSAESDLYLTFLLLTGRNFGALPNTTTHIRLNHGLELLSLLTVAIALALHEASQLLSFIARAVMRVIGLIMTTGRDWRYE